MRPFYQDPALTLYHARCEDILPTLEPQSIDLMIHDPPYFKTKLEYNGQRLEWDRQWPSETAYLDWLRELCMQWQRVLKPNGSLYLFASPKMAAPVEMVLRERFTLLNTITWQKPMFSTKAEMFVKEDLCSYFPASERILFAEHKHADNMAACVAGYASQCETLHGHVFESIRAYLDGERQRAGISFEQVRQMVGCAPGSGLPSHWFTRSQWILPTAENYAKLQEGFNRLGNGRSEYLRTEYAELRTEYAELRTKYEELRTEYEELRRPFQVTARDQYTDVWTFRPVPAGVGKHPCEKPLALFEHIIRTSSRPKALVLDCFLGSGSTLEAAKRLGRRAIGMEMDLAWCRRSTDRLRQEVLPFVTD